MPNFIPWGVFVVRISIPSNFTFHFINRVTGLVMEGVTAFLQRHSTEVQHMSLGISISQCGQSPPRAYPAHSSSKQQVSYFLNTQAVDDDGRGRKISQFCPCSAHWREKNFFRQKARNFGFEIYIYLELAKFSPSLLDI